MGAAGAEADDLVLAREDGLVRRRHDDADLADHYVDGAWTHIGEPGYDAFLHKGMQAYAEQRFDTAAELFLSAAEQGEHLCHRRVELAFGDVLDHLVDGEAGTAERLTAGLDRTESHDLGVQTGHTGRHDARERGETQLLCLGVAHDHDSRGAVVQRACVAGRDLAVGTEHRLQLRGCLVGGAGARAVVLGDHGAVRKGHGHDLALGSGSWDGVFGAEAFVVLSGRGVVTDQHGGRIELAPGVVGVLEAGDLTHWTITEPLRKVWIVTQS